MHKLLDRVVHFIRRKQSFWFGLVNFSFLNYFISIYLVMETNHVLKAVHYVKVKLL